MLKFCKTLKIIKKLLFRFLLIFCFSFFLFCYNTLSNITMSSVKQERNIKHDFRQKRTSFPLIFSIAHLKSNGLGPALLSSLSHGGLLVHETSLITFIWFLLFMPSVLALPSEIHAKTHRSCLLQTFREDI